MQFNSIEYLLFLPTLFLLYWFVFKSRKAQNLLIVVASYYFYGSWNPRCLILIATTTFCSYLSALLLQKSEGKSKLRKLISAANILLNLLILGVFKYFNFFAENFASLLKTFGITADCVTLDILLPVGISFYTFQALSYTIDVYKHKIEPTKDIVAFFAYISFFPQLVAGPIERATNLLPQFLKERQFNYASAVDGMRQILWGLAKKMLVADTCAMAVDTIFRDYQTLDGSMLLLGGVLFAFQIYGDFSGYSDIAIGSSRLFGIGLMQNFKNPYLSRDIAEFWRRWHISLTTWFRDYIYIPLGGSRGSKAMTIRNTFIIFLVSGLWHGANWTFICWGLYHALLFMPLLLLGRNRRYTDTVAQGRVIPSIKELFQIAVTFLLVVFGWIIFRAESIGEAAEYITRIFTDFHLTMPPYGRRALLLAALLIIVEWFQRDKMHGLQIEYKGVFRYRAVRWALYYLLFIAIILFAGSNTQFIYFQF